MSGYVCSELITYHPTPMGAQYNITYSCIETQLDIFGKAYYEQLIQYRAFEGTTVCVVEMFLFVRGFECLHGRFVHGLPGVESFPSVLHRDCTCTLRECDRMVRGILEAPV